MGLPPAGYKCESSPPDFLSSSTINIANMANNKAIKKLKSFFKFL